MANELFSENNFVPLKYRFMENLCVNGTFEIVDDKPITIVQDFAGNLIELDINGEMIIPPSDVPQDCCMICRKKVRVLGSTHNKCRRLMDKLERAKQKVLNAEFELFCLKYTTGDNLNLEALCIDD